MVHSVDSSPLGQKTNYVSTYDAGLLFPISRSESRAVLGIGTSLPFYGYDVWTGYELSWLNAKGKPQVAVAEFTIPCDSPHIIESKSFKLYLNSLNQTRFADFDTVKSCLVNDLSAAAGAAVSITLQPLAQSTLTLHSIKGICIDDADIDIETYHPEPNFLSVDSREKTSELLYSHLLKSNCPVTGQPDWASVFIEYTGPKLHRENLLRYIISFREHQDFHEHCVERIFVDIMDRCKPESLSVYARYTRRGGLDINPFRATGTNILPVVNRLIRQ